MADDKYDDIVDHHKEYITYVDDDYVTYRIPRSKVSMIKSTPLAVAGMARLPRTATDGQILAALRAQPYQSLTVSKLIALPRHAVGKPPQGTRAIVIDGQCGVSMLVYDPGADPAVKDPRKIVGEVDLMPPKNEEMAILIPWKESWLYSMWGEMIWKVVVEGS